MKIAFLDRDGTIIQDYPDARWPLIKSPEFIEGSIAAIKIFRDMGYEIIIVTNQYIIDEGFIRQPQYQQINQKMLDTLAIEDIDILDVFHCPHARNNGCYSQKPKPGMIENALHKYPNIRLDQSFLAGDSNCDAELAAHFRLPFYAIGMTSIYAKTTPVSSLLEAASLLKAGAISPRSHTQ